MNYYAVTTHETEPEVHALDVYLGYMPPELPDKPAMETFIGEVPIRSFLLGGEWDKVTVFKSPECSQEEVNELLDWMAQNMSLENVFTSGGGGDGS